MRYFSEEQLPIVLSAKEVASVLGVSRSQAYVLMNSGDFPTLRIGKRMVVVKDKLFQWMEEHTAGRTLPPCEDDGEEYTQLRFDFYEGDE